MKAPRTLTELNAANRAMWDRKPVEVASSPAVAPLATDKALWGDNLRALKVGSLNCGEKTADDGICPECGKDPCICKSADATDPLTKIAREVEEIGETLEEEGVTDEGEEEEELEEITDEGEEEEEEVTDKDEKEGFVVNT